MPGRQYINTYSERHWTSTVSERQYDNTDKDVQETVCPSKRIVAETKVLDRHYIRVYGQRYWTNTMSELSMVN